MPDEKRYTAEQLAALAGVSLRTVRYYVQEELIDRPLGRGPGSHFNDTHLRQLKRCKLLQDWGFDLETIRDQSNSFQSILDGYAVDANFMSHGATLRALFGSPGNEAASLTPRQTEVVKALAQRLRGRSAKPAPERTSTTEIVPMADGVNLVIDTTLYDIPSPKELVEIALLIRKAFDPLKRRDEDKDD